MSDVPESWMAELKECLHMINMSFEKWQAAYPYDFKADHDAGISPRDAATRANAFWWKEQDKVFNPRDFHPPTKI